MTTDLESALTNARLAVNDWHNCSTQDELNRWRAAQQRLIEAAKACGRAEILERVSRASETAK